LAIVGFRTGFHRKAPNVFWAFISLEIDV
jgi:hypothetical protein